MDATTISITVIASIFGLVATILTILTFFNNRKKDGQQDSREIATMKTDIVYIKDGIGELKTMIQAQTKEQTATNLKLQQLEDRCISIEKRVELLEKHQSIRRKSA